MEPINAISAAVHPDPYPYYAGLLNAAPLSFDRKLDCWVAARAATVMEVLANPDCAVRPGAEPVPKAIVNSRAGEVFGYLMRMNDGVNHAMPKLAVQRALSSVDLVAVKKDAQRILGTLAGSKDLRRPDDLTRWAHDASAFVIGGLLGFSGPQLPPLADWLSRFVACVSPLSSAQQLEDAARAAAVLLEQFHQLLQRETTSGGTLVARVKAEADSVLWNNAGSFLSNLIGLLLQAYEGTAGLIGNTIVAIATQPGLEKMLRLSSECIETAVDEVSRFDPSVQNTRRFVARRTVVAGTELQPGDVIILLLAAANRDPVFNQRPHEFIIDRPARRTLGFGHGIHACPGQLLAGAIASSGVKVALELLSPADIASLGWNYRASVNGRIPMFIEKNTNQEQP
jgi:cytochrome P450